MFSEKRLKHGYRPTFAEGCSFSADKNANPIYSHEFTDRDSNDFSPTIMRKNPNLLIPTRFSIDNKEEVDINDVLAPFVKEADEIESNYNKNEK